MPNAKFLPSKDTSEQSVHCTNIDLHTNTVRVTRGVFLRTTSSNYVRQTPNSYDKNHCGKTAPKTLDQCSCYELKSGHLVEAFNVEYC